MTYTLYIGDRTFSSWSLRGWLMLEKFDLPFSTKTVGLYSGTMANDLAHLAPAKTVPVMTTPAGHVVTDSLAMGETLNEAHPDAGLYPADAGARALARSMVAEMHSGFGALRNDCGMNLANLWDGFQPSKAVQADVSRIEHLWELARSQYGTTGPWLFGDYSLVDAFYAPVACRFATYGLARSQTSHDYINATLADPTLRRWRAMGATKTYDPFPYPQDLPSALWPIPNLIAAKPVANGPARNDVCPYSGDPVTHFMETGGQVYGFCNAFCRDKTVNDPAAWPQFMELHKER